MTRKLTRRALKEILSKAKFITVNDVIGRVISTCYNTDDKAFAVEYKLEGDPHTSELKVGQLLGAKIITQPVMQGRTYLLIYMAHDEGRNPALVQFFDLNPLIKNEQN